MTQTNFQPSATQKKSTQKLLHNYIKARIPSPQTRLLKVFSIIYKEIVITCRN